MIFKLIGIAVIGVIVVTLLRSAKPEFAVFATIATGVVDGDNDAFRAS